MARLPVPGGDKDAWGAILNEFLDVAHAADGAIDTPGTTRTGTLIVAPGASQVQIGSDGKIYWTSGYDTNLYRAAAGTLKTDNDLHVASDLFARAGNAAGQIALTSAGIYFGSTLDTRLYRLQAGVLKTPGSIQATAFTVAAASKPGEEPGDEINLLTLIEQLADRVAELEARLAE